MTDVFDPRPCTLGEGPLWHPARHQLFWFDITAKKLLSRVGDATLEWRFDEEHSAAAWIDRDTLLLASASGLWRFSLTDGARDKITKLEETNAATRSNDGRADPWGGFWIGTMGRGAEPKAGAIYRFYQGQLRKLVADVTISNAICFAPNRGLAYYTDTVTRQVMRITLDRSGWPAGKPEVLIDLKPDTLNPDGAVVDADGRLWIAAWGAGRVVVFAPDGSFLRQIDVPARQPTCPAFGGPDLRDLYVTSARQSLDSAQIKAEPRNGQTFVIRDVAAGLPEPKVIL